MSGSETGSITERSRAETGESLGGDAAGFQVRDVSFAVAGRDLLADVCLELAPGHLYGLIGHNGSGKSTLMNLLARQHEPTSGCIVHTGQPLAQWPQRAFARAVGYMAQRLPEATGLKVRELAELGRYPWHGTVGRFTPRDRERVDRALELTGMSGLADRLVDTLSGGERQRAWLAMLVAQDTHTMLLDEPISELDVAHQMDVMQRVRALCHECGLIVVAVLHDINIAARFCDRLVALREGRLIAEGSPAELIRSDVLERIYGVPMGVVQAPGVDLPISYVA
jgi:ferric hydroxamate transport system ATP-binding protein